MQAAPSRLLCEVAQTRKRGQKFLMFTGDLRRWTNVGYRMKLYAVSFALTGDLASCFDGVKRLTQEICSTSVRHGKQSIEESDDF